MNRKDLRASTQTERDQYVVRPCDQIPLTQLVEGSFSHLVSTQKATFSFLTMKAVRSLQCIRIPKSNS